MKLRRLAACAALVTFAASAALAEPITVKLQTPTSEKVKFIAGGAVFTCEADACVALAPASRTFGPGPCRQVAAKVGPVVSFSGRKALDEARLAECNAAAPRAAKGPQLASQ